MLEDEIEICDIVDVTIENNWDESIPKNVIGRLRSNLMINNINRFKRRISDDINEN